MSGGTLAALGWFFLKAGAFIFGSGLAIVPFLRDGVVHQHHWLTDSQFLDAVAMGLITPGPVVITATFIGYLTAGWLGAVPSMERVDVVELEPAVLRVAQACEAVNHAALQNPRVHITIGDAREILAVLREKRAHGEVSAQWFEERSHTLENEMIGDAEQQSRLTSEYTFLGVLRHHVQRLIADVADTGEEKSGSALSRAV